MQSRTSPPRRHRGPGVSLWAFLVVALGLWVLAAAPAAAQGPRTVTLGAEERVLLQPGFTMTLQTDRPFADIVVGNPNVADVLPLTERSLFVQGQGSGSTNIAFLDEDRNLLGVIDVRVQRGLDALREAISRAVPGVPVEVTNVNDRIRVSGVVRDRVARDRILEIAQQFSEAEVVDALRIADGQQVELQVRILEVSRQAGRNLGVGLEAERANPGRRNVAFRTAGGFVGTATPFGNLVGEVLGLAGANIDIVISALEQRGLARRLSQPTLVTTSGVDANFVVGGEVPFQTVDADGQTSVQFRPFGITLGFVPVVLDEGLISLEVRPEVSDVDFSVAVNGQPGFIVRRAQTTVSLRDGQSFAIAGLLDVDNVRQMRQVPWIGQVPILGALFRSAEFQRNETDLVIVVTPRLVQPARPGQRLASPLDDTRSSNDVELFLLGLLEVDRDLLRRFADGGGVVGPYGHMIDLSFDDDFRDK